jgi:hypothetical protein
MGSNDERHDATLHHKRAAVFAPASARCIEGVETTSLPPYWALGGGMVFAMVLGESKQDLAKAHPIS